MWYNKGVNVVKTKGGRGGAAGGNGLVALAIDKDKGSQNALRWAAESILTRGQTVVLIHVIHRQSAITSLAGSNAIICDSNNPSDSPRKQQLEKMTNDLFLTFRSIAIVLERIYTALIDVILEDTDIAKALTEYVSYAAIETLVLGAPAKHGFIRMTSTICKKEILMDILVRLPAKTLMRFLCSCKSWSDLISSPNFVTTHLNTNFTKRKNVHLLCLHHPDFKRVVDLNDPFVKQPLQWSLFHHETFEQGLGFNHPLGSTNHYGIYGSSNGLVCISDDPDVLSCRSPILIWNPSIKKFKTLPLSTSNKFRYMSLQFGFHPRVNDYKVIRMMWINKDAFAVEVYSLSTNSWKMIEEIPPWLKCKFEHREGSFINGVAYRILEKGCIFTVVSFDSGNEEFEEFVLPDSINSIYGLHIHSFEERACLFFHNYCSTEEGFDRSEFWVLQDKRWKQMSPFYYPQNSYHIIGVRIDNEVLMETRDYCNGVADLYLVNYETREARETEIKLAIMRYNHQEVLFVFTYIESLVLLN